MHANHQPSSSDRARLLLLLGLGLATELVYAVWLVAPAYLPDHLHRQRIDMVDLYGNGVPGMIAYAAPMVLAFALYLAAIMVVRNITSPWGATVVFAWAVTHAVTFALMFPGAALDIFHYAIEARVLWVYHENPLTTLPISHPQDPFAWYAAWGKTPSPYGPLWSMVAIAPGWFGHGHVLRTVLGFKAIAVAFHLGIGALAYIGLRDRPPLRLPATLLVLWNPLLLFETAGNGHNDVAMVFFVLLALVLEQRELHLGAVLALTASALFKFVSLLLLPPLVLYIAMNFGSQTRRELIQALGLSVALVGAAYFPFWDGVATLHALREQAGLMANSPAAVLARLLEARLEASEAALTTKWLMTLAFGAVYCAALVRPVLMFGGSKVEIHFRLAGSFIGLLEVLFDVVFLYLLFAFWFQPWYLIWLVPIAAILADRRRTAVAVVFSLTAALMYVPVTFGWQRYFMQWGPTWPHRLAVLTVFPLPLLIWLWAVRPWPSILVRRAENGRGAIEHVIGEEPPTVRTDVVT